MWQVCVKIKPAKIYLLEIQIDVESGSDLKREYCLISSYEEKPEHFQQTFTNY